MATIQEITEEATSKYADLGWIKIHYNEAGSGDPPVILLHGGGLGASSWSNFVLNIPVFAEHFRVLAVDAPSYGKSDSYVATEPRTSVNARAVKDLMDNLGIEKASLVGNSMGGGTALTFAVDYPERLEKMILMGSAGGGTPMFSQNPTEGIKALMAVFQDQSFENFRKMFDLMLYDGSTVPDEVLRARIASVNQNHLKAFRESAGAAFQRNLVLDLPDVKTPTLITHGRDDRVVRWRAAFRCWRCCPTPNCTCSTSAAIGCSTSTPPTSTGWCWTSCSTTTRGFEIRQAVGLSIQRLQAFEGAGAGSG